jgi:ribonuclease E
VATFEPQAAAPVSEPVAEVASDDPPKSKRKGWWSLGR